MFEVTGSDVAALTDVDLRTLVARLALAEMRGVGLPKSSVTAGGSQTAPDGGLDVRVSVPGSMVSPDFVPRAETGFQVKKPDMGAAAIAKEMKPKGQLRPIFQELADRDGAYIIVSAQGSVTDTPLQDRKNAMRDTLAELKDGARIHVDFYDRDRMAIWINGFPGVAAWVMGRLGRRLSGWSAIGEWVGTRAGEIDDYLSGGATCIIDERTKEREALTLLEGIARIRQSLSEAGTCVRLIGLSGVGKTRLVQALFEDGVGIDALDPGIAIYTDYSDNIDPTARDMARQLVGAGERAVLVVDNCNPATHGELAKICHVENSKVSLLTVEYDVRDDEPEHTEVFRLQSVSPEIVDNWIAKHFPAISQLDREKIAEFSDGNFRVARALADTLGKGETLGQLKSRDLFTRIFDQRAGTTADLLQAAEDLSLVYSYDGEDTSSGSELGRIAAIRGTAPQQLFRATAELKGRGIVQIRGRWRALLPHAIANPLAARALERISASDFDVFYHTLGSRMKRSLTRRLGYLHDSPAAQMTIKRWLDVGGPLDDLTELGEDGVAILRNLAPVAPKGVLSKIRKVSTGPCADKFLDATTSNRTSLIGLVKALAFEPEMFDDAAWTLVQFLCAEPNDKTYNSARNAFKELFHLYLSGTGALIDQRIALTRRLVNSHHEGEHRCGMLALEGLLEANYFVSHHSFDFGARPRNYGWQPQTYEDVRRWYTKAIELAVELKNDPDTSKIFAQSIRFLWWSSASLDALEAASMAFADGGAWIDGWLNFRGALRFGGKAMPEDCRKQLERIIDCIKPVDLADRTRALVLQHSHDSYDIVDGEEHGNDGESVHRAYLRAFEAAVDVGKAVAVSPPDLNILLPEILSTRKATRAFQFGRGLAQGSFDLNETWLALIAHYRVIPPDKRSPVTMGGFLSDAHIRDADFTTPVLEDLTRDSDLASLLPYLQAHVAMDKVGIARLRAAIARSLLSSGDFRSIENVFIDSAPPADLKDLLLDIASLPGGVPITIEMLHMYIFGRGKPDDQIAPELIDAGRDLLTQLSLEKAGAHDYSVGLIIQRCLTGPEGEGAARHLCWNIRSRFEACKVSMHDVKHLLEGLFSVQPTVALDELLIAEHTIPLSTMRAIRFGNSFPVDKIPENILTDWADQDAEFRYKLLSQEVGIFNGKDEGALSISPIYLSLLTKAPDKSQFLGNYRAHFYPRSSWSGSLADILIRRRDILRQLASHPDGAVQQWAAAMEAPVAEWIETERPRDRRHEESFE